jgi:hypothetical protein
MGNRGSSPGVKQPGLEADHSPPSSTKVKECVELYFHSPYTLSWRSAQFKKRHRDNSTFTFTFLHWKINDRYLNEELIKEVIK